MAKIFDYVKAPKLNYTKFNLGHEVKFSFNMGEITPLICEEVVPGDEWNVSHEIMVRMSPLVAPIMHRVNVFTHYFFVPNRLVWSNWEKFITANELGTQPLMPMWAPVEALTEGFEDWQKYVKAGSLLDYLGISEPIIDETPSDFHVRVNLLAVKACALIWNEYFRDQNLQEEIDIDKDRDGYYTITDPDDAQILQNLLQIRKRAWEKDYFTSALPFTQKGPQANIPVSGESIVEWDEETENSQKTVRFSNGDPVETAGMASDSLGNLELNVPGEGYIWGAIDPNGTLKSDLQNVSIDINELRRASRLQEWLERAARAGSRYIETILANFNVLSSDARLQRPEFLGSTRNPIVISEVLQTAQTSETSPQGNMAGHGISFGNSNGFTKRFEEYGYVIGFVTVMPRTAYQQGVRRHFLKRDKFDYYWPSFANLGEQPVYLAELWNSGHYEGPNGPEELPTFGYQSRYSEYKYIPGSVHGEFKKPGLDSWHMGRIFETEPTLSEEFIECDPTRRVFAVTDEESNTIYAYALANVSVKRKMPFFGTPKL